MSPPLKTLLTGNQLFSKVAGITKKRIFSPSTMKSTQRYNVDTVLFKLSLIIKTYINKSTERCILLDPHKVAQPMLNLPGIYLHISVYKVSTVCQEQWLMTPSIRDFKSRYLQLNCENNTCLYISKPNCEQCVKCQCRSTDKHTS